MQGKSTGRARPAATIRLWIPPLPKYGKYVRERIAAFAAARGVPQADTEEFISAVSEALANAIEHSGTKDVEVICSVIGHDRLEARVIDRGIGFSADAGCAQFLPDPLAERGRGLPLMRRYTDRVTVTSAPGQGTTVRLIRALRYPARIAG